MVWDIGKSRNTLSDPRFASREIQYDISDKSRNLFHANLNVEKYI